MSQASISRPHGIVKWRCLLDTPVPFTSQARIAGRRGIAKWISLVNVEVLFAGGFLASRSKITRNHSAKAARKGPTLGTARHTNTQSHRHADTQARRYTDTKTHEH